MRVRQRENETERQRRRQRDREIKQKMTPIFGLFHVPDLSVGGSFFGNSLCVRRLFNSARLVNSAKSYREHRPRHLNDDDDDEMG